MSEKAYFHLPGLFEYAELYEKFLSLYLNKREYFYEWCAIASIYGAPEDTLWSGGRTGFGKADTKRAIDQLNRYRLSGRLTFSNSLIEERHLSDACCNKLCELFNNETLVRSGVIIYSDTLKNYLKEKYPNLYFVSSTTKVLTSFEDFKKELDREDFAYVVPDFRLNKDFEDLKTLSPKEKDKIEFLVNECCYVGCKDRRICYESVSRKNLGEEDDFVCKAPGLREGYRFSLAKKNPSFISIEDIEQIYLPMGFTNFKIEGRGLGSALILEFLLYYLIKPEYQLEVREAIYLDNMLDLF